MAPSAIALGRAFPAGLAASAWRDLFTIRGGRSPRISRPRVSRTGGRLRLMAMSGWMRGPRRRASVFVVTRRLRGVPERQGGTSLTFVTEGLELVPTRVVEVPEVTHIRLFRTRMESNTSARVLLRVLMDRLRRAAGSGGRCRGSDVQLCLSGVGWPLAAPERDRCADDEPGNVLGGSWLRRAPEPGTGLSECGEPARVIGPA